MFDVVWSRCIRNCWKLWFHWLILERIPQYFSLCQQKVICNVRQCKLFSSLAFSSSSGFLVNIHFSTFKSITRLRDRVISLMGRHNEILYVNQSILSLFLKQTFHMHQEAHTAPRSNSQPTTQGLKLTCSYFWQIFVYWACSSSSL